MAGFGKLKNDLAAIGVKTVAASVDPLDKAKEVADEVGLPIGYGVTRAQADEIGAWWEDRRQIVQPAEFVVRDGKVVISSYSAGPLGRMEASDVVKLINFYDKRK